MSPATGPSAVDREMALKGPDHSCKVCVLLLQPLRTGGTSWETAALLGDVSGSGQPWKKESEKHYALLEPISPSFWR